MILNDLQSRLNETSVLQISAPGDIDEAVSYTHLTLPTNREV